MFWEIFSVGVGYGQTQFGEVNIIICNFNHFDIYFEYLIATDSGITVIPAHHRFAFSYILLVVVVSNTNQDLFPSLYHHPREVYRG